MSHDPLGALRADLFPDDDAPVRDVADIHRRAAVLRRRRRGRAGAASAVGVAAALAVAGVVLPPGPGSGGDTSAVAYLGITPARAADGTAADCRLAYGSDIPVVDLADRPDAAAVLALLEDGSGAPPLRSVWARQDELRCPPPVPALVAYDLSPVRGVSVWPDVANPYTREPGLVRTQVRGAPGELLTFEEGGHVLSWVEPDGERWLAEASGVDVAELVAFLDGLGIDEENVVTGAVPDGFDQAPVPTRTPDLVQPGWSAAYGSGREGVHLGAQEIDHPVVALAARWSGFTTTRVGEHPALYDETEGGGTLRWDADGRQYTLSGQGGIERLVRLAEQVRPITADDPRLVGVPETWRLPTSSPTNG